MAKRSVRDMLKARAWKGQVSLADVDPGDRLGVSRKKIAAAREKYGPELLDLQERLYAEKKQAILIVLQGLDTSGKDGTVRHLMAAMDPQGVHVRTFMAPSATELRHHFLWRFKKEMPGHRRYFSNSRGGPGACSRLHRRGRRGPGRGPGPHPGSFSQVTPSAGSSNAAANLGQ